MTTATLIPAADAPTPLARTAAPLMQVVAGFWASKTLAAAVELDLFTRLSGNPVTVDQLCETLEIQPRPAEMLLSGCAALGLLETVDGRFANSPLAEQYLVRGRPYYFGGVVTMLDRRLYLPWDRLAEAIKTNRAQTWGDQPGLFEAISANPEEQRIFTEVMPTRRILARRASARPFDSSPYGKLADASGSSAA